MWSLAASAATTTTQANATILNLVMAAPRLGAARVGLAAMAMLSINSAPPVQGRLLVLIIMVAALIIIMEHGQLSR